MLRRYPYWGWLLLSLILWCINGYNFHMHKQALQPEKMTKVVANDLEQRSTAFDQFVNNKELVQRVFNNTLTEEETKKICSYPFLIFCYDNDTLKFWNTNTVLADVNTSISDEPHILRNEKGVYVEKCLRMPFLDIHKRLVVLFPIVITYPLENDYLKSHFAAANNIPVETEIIAAGETSSGAYPVTMKGSGIVFSLQYDNNAIQDWTPDALFILLLITSLLTSIWWIQLMTIYFTRKHSSMSGFLITLSVIVVLRSLLYLYGLPFNLSALTFFSPALYASSIYLSSLGDLFINTLCILWLVIFLTRHTPYKSYFAKVKNAPARIGIAILLISCLLAYIYLFVNIIRSLVLDSSISFDVSHFYSINIYTILGLLVIGCITGISCLIVYLFNTLLNTLFRNKVLKYIAIALTGVALIAITGFNYNPGLQHTSFDWKFYWLLLGWLMVFIPLLDIPNFSLASDLFEPQMIFWAVFICLFCTSILQYFNEVKESDTRLTFAKLKLSAQRDDLAEYTFHKIADSVLRDKEIKNFLYKPTVGERKIINQHFDAQYFSSTAINKYQTTVFLFDANEKGLFNKDSTVSYTSLLEEKNESFTTNFPSLFYKEDRHERHFYLSYIPIYNDTINKIIGYVIIDIDFKKQATQLVYPELLQPSVNKTNPRENEYAYAVYMNGKLVAQTNDYPFTNILKNDTFKTEYTFKKNKNVSELYYKIGEKRTAVVVHIHSHVIEMITLFSYLFGIQVLLAVVILVYQLYLSYFTNTSFKGKFIRLTLRKRVHFSMLLVALISFVIIGTVTIIVFTDQFRTSNKIKLHSALQTAKKAISEVLKTEGAMRSAYSFDTVSASARFKNYISGITAAQTIDINIFNSKGVLMSTSEDEIYNKGLISSMMRPDAFYQMNDLGKSIVIQDERVAGLSYLSAYQPIRNEHGTILGYINLPLFSSEKELHFQISNIVVTLINLYAFIFLLSSMITVLITRWITRTFNIIIEQFSRLNLQKNERISWPYDDEIGLLVLEYNKMVNKVEENAALLAQSERESAWREMARQVAHEIKNPLTPMKLNIQYLQQAVKNDHPKIKELTDKVSLSIIEQIDNLSYIASEFSNFAKMPEARPEELDLVTLLNKAVELYKPDENTRVSLIGTTDTLPVYSDKSQLLRVFTNLLENARQAIPEGIVGEIVVTSRRENNDVIISISDNGQGISEDVISRIFQPYFTTKSSGTGLGLAMTKKIIEFWKGEIWFDTKVGEGTTFHIRLPLIKDEK